MTPEEEQGMIYSNVTQDGRRLTWKQLAEDRENRIRAMGAWEALVMDLDRCEHGRHRQDACSQCEGQSHGNPFAPPGTRIGTTLSGSFAIVVPEAHEKHDPEAWRRTP